MAKLVKAAMSLAGANGMEGDRMSGLEGQANLAQATERPVGRKYNLGVPGSRKSRKSRSR